LALVRGRKGGEALLYIREHAAFSASKKAVGFIEYNDTSTSKAAYRVFT
jgi:hypothetical protein